MERRQVWLVSAVCLASAAALTLGMGTTSASFSAATESSGSAAAAMLDGVHAPAGGVTSLTAASTVAGCTISWSGLNGGLAVADRLELVDLHSGAVVAGGPPGDVTSGTYGPDASGVVQSYVLRSNRANDWVSPDSQTSRVTCMNMAVRSAAAGHNSTCAIRADETLHCWGFGGLFANAHPSMFTTAQPAAVPGTGWRQVSVGSDAGCGLKHDGTLWCWGDNWTGQLGTGATPGTTTSPVQVGTDTDWVSVAAFRYSACGIRAPGTLWCWGRGSSGQLGNGSTAAANLPTQVGTAQDWQSVDGNGATTCGSRLGGTLWCWGSNGSGELGNGTTSNSSVPSQVGGGASWTSSFAVGFEHTCALSDDGTMWCWGTNWHGERGATASLPSSIPHPVNADADWTQIVAGSYFTCALKTDRTMWCTGTNSLGRTGQSISTGNTIAFTQVGAATNWSHLTGRNEHTCAVNDADELHCWGWDGAGQVGIQDTSWASPHNVDPLATWQTTTGGYRHTCAIKTDQSLWCFGDNDNGQLGAGFSSDGVIEPRNPMPGTSFVSVAPGDFHTCAVTALAELYCWGRNQEGELGTGGTPGLARTPLQVGTDQDWAIVASGRDHSCAIRTDQKLWCWGENSSGKLGDGTTIARSVPTQLGAADWIAVDAGHRHSCGIQVDNTLWCWGANSDGQLGDGTGATQLAPTQIGSATDWVSVGLGFKHSCGVRADGSGWCWGANANGQVGNGTTTTQLVPTALTPAMGWTRIDGGEAFSCGLRATADSWCWGTNRAGQFGTGSVTTGSLTPTALFGNLVDFSVATGGDHTCAIDTTSVLRCWGSNDSGQLAMDSAVTTPALVAGGHTWLP